MADVGTHLVDLVEWTLFPGQHIDYRKDVQVLKADREPLMLTRQQFERVTGEHDWPAYLRRDIKVRPLGVFLQQQGGFTIHGVYVSLKVRWQYEAPPGHKDSYFASYRGRRSQIDLRAGPEEHFVPQITVTPTSDRDRDALLATLRSKLETLQSQYPGIRAEPAGSGFHIVVPDRARAPENSYFSLLAARFLDYVRNPKSLPNWEKANMLTKYYVTTTAVEMAGAGSK